MPYVRLLLSDADDTRLNAILRNTFPEASKFVTQVECPELGKHPLHFTLCGSVQNSGLSQVQVQEELRKFATRHSGGVDVKFEAFVFSGNRVQLNPVLPSPALTALAQDVAGVLAPLGDEGRRPNPWYAEPENHHVTCGAKDPEWQPTLDEEQSYKAMLSSFPTSFHFDCIQYAYDPILPAVPLCRGGNRKGGARQQPREEEEEYQ